MLRVSPRVTLQLSYELYELYEQFCVKCDVTLEHSARIARFAVGFQIQLPVVQVY
jgi:hypothetical protein